MMKASKIREDISEIMSELLVTDRGPARFQPAYEQFSGQMTDPAQFSRRRNGSLDWTVMDIIVIQHVTKSDRLNDYLRSLRRNQVAMTPMAEAASMIEIAAQVYKESGEAASELAKCGDEVDARTHAETLRELREAKAVIERAIARVEAMPITPVLVQREARA
ncbi:hypothetical protein [Thioclava sp. GXIMD4215]|uniref:hypothetical protein n=1 Tax=Thioclava sp. GXIMD4215 TaxID=3131928 RepID=UPI003244B8D4